MGDSAPDFYCVLGPWYNESGLPEYDFEPVIMRANLSSEDGSSVTCDNVPTSFLGSSPAIGNFKVNLNLTFDLQEMQWNQTL